MLNLNELSQPLEFWEYFEQITKIPRCSEHEEKVRAFIKEEAKRLGFKTQIDNTGNLVVRIPAKSKKKQKVILQCHMDMVCEKNEEIIHDFSKDPLKIKVIEIENESWITAEGTTLGADNGVGICYLLTLMKKIHDGELGYESIEFDLLYTVDEEMGLNGAFKIDNDLIDGKYLINLDAEDENAVIIGCAGGIVTSFHIKNDTYKIDEEKDLIPMKLLISGLIGGHSGVDIHIGRGNSLKLIGQILWKLNKNYIIKIASIDGGNRPNAIPREANAIFFVKGDQYPDIKKFISNIVMKINILYESIEPDIKISIKKLTDYNDKEVLTKSIQDNLLNILYTIPNGLLSMHPKIKDLVFTSSNLAVIKTEKDKIQIILSQRSLSEYFKKVIWEKANSLIQLSGLDVETIIESDYPGWTPEFDSKLLTLTKESYKEIFNKDILVKAIHAGLECGILKKKFPHMEMISIGPKNEGAHSPDERLLVKSVEKIWNFLLTLLKKLN
ncbi:MAG: beta-Ala-His dipeptidase [Promethearchaeota archaeon]